MRARFRAQGLSVAVGLCLLMPITAEAQSERSAYEELQMFSGVLNHIRRNYADTISYRQMIRAAIDGILKNLDPHSYFLSRADNLALGRIARGDLASVGIHLEPVDQALVVRTLDRGGTAERAGVFPGDRLIAVDDTSVAGLDSKAVEARLAGPKGSNVGLRLERGPRLEPETLDLRLERELIDYSVVNRTLPLDSVTVYVKVDQFGTEAANDLERVIKKARKSGYSQVVLDLRGNPGGFVGEAVDMATLFLPSSTPVFSTRGRVRDVNVDYRTKRDGPFQNVPLVVLVDEGSASAAEALAGAMQDLDRAVILGRRTFGKAVVQSPFFLPDGDIVWLTIGRVVTPSGRVIQRDYRGLTEGQYRSFAGVRSDEMETQPLFTTAGGRQVRGGGGIRPDVMTARPPAPPVWWTLASQLGLIQEVVDSVAVDFRTVDGDGSEWISQSERWMMLVAPLLERVRLRLSLSASISNDTHDWMARFLAARVVSAAWGVAAEEEFEILSDPDVVAAIAVFPRWRETLARAKRTVSEEGR